MQHQVQPTNTTDEIFVEGVSDAHAPFQQTNYIRYGFNEERIITDADQNK